MVNFLKRLSLLEKAVAALTEKVNADLEAKKVYKPPKRYSTQGVPKTLMEELAKQSKGE